jgi:arylsulfatase
MIMPVRNGAREDIIKARFCEGRRQRRLPLIFSQDRLLLRSRRPIRPLIYSQDGYWEHEGNAAVRVDDWKLVRYHGDGAWELYNLKTDRTELHDLAAQDTERAKEMAAKWESWALRVQVKPYPDEKKRRGAGGKS